MIKTRIIHSPSQSFKQSSKKVEDHQKTVKRLSETLIMITAGKSAWVSSRILINLNAMMILKTQRARLSQKMLTHNLQSFAQQSWDDYDLLHENLMKNFFNPIHNKLAVAMKYAWIRMKMMAISFLWVEKLQSSYFNHQFFSST